MMPDNKNLLVNSKMISGKLLKFWDVMINALIMEEKMANAQVKSLRSVAKKEPFKSTLLMSTSLPLAKDNTEILRNSAMSKLKKSTLPSQVSSTLKKLLCIETSMEMITKCITTGTTTNPEIGIKMQSMTAGRELNKTLDLNSQMINKEIWLSVMKS